MNQPIEITLEQTDVIIETRKPLGLFYTHTTKDPVDYVDDAGAHRFKGDEDLFIGIDNSTGDAWTEEFDNLEQCLNWLNK